MYKVVVSMFLLSMAMSWGRSGSSLAFYLVKSPQLQNESSLWLVNVTYITLETTPFIESSDIISYSRAHEIILKKPALARFEQIPVGEVFACCVGKRLLYLGRIWNWNRSSTCSDIILVVGYDDRTKLCLLTGYPTSAYFRGRDLRSDLAVLEALKNDGKLHE